MGERRSAMKIQKWYKKLKIRLADLFFKWSMKLNPRRPFPALTTSFQRPYHLKRMVVPSIGDYELIRVRRDIDPKVIQSDWMRLTMEDLMGDMVRNGLVYFHLEQDGITRQPYLVAEVDVLETGHPDNYVDNTDLFKQ